MTSITRSQAIAADMTAQLRARTHLFWIVTQEEERVERYLAQAARAAKYEVRTWDVAQGVADADGVVISNMGSADPAETLNTIKARATATVGTVDRAVWIMRDLPVWLSGPPGAATMRALRNLARLLPGIDSQNAQSVMILSPSGEVPPELAGHATVINWPLPDRAEIGELLDAALEPYTDEQIKKPTNGQREAAIDAAVGLSGEEAQACYARSLVQNRSIEPATIAQEKRRVIARDGLLEWYDPIPGGLDAVGGLENLKAWLLSRSTAYSPKARAYGLPAPRGSMFIGISGCGKSLMAKCLATNWQVPLIRMDLGSLKSKYVGESEANLRKAFSIIEAMGRCVLWLDEVEKALQGATSGSADGGVSSDAMGAILTWMQERKSEAFIVATANDVSQLPPEFLRKGRWDETWWVDLPNVSERESVLAATLRQFGRGKVEIDLKRVAASCKDFTGSEIAAIVPDALYAAFGDGEREITTDDLVRAAATVTPLAQTAAEKIDAMRKWANGRCRPASMAVAGVVSLKTARAVDL